MNEDTVTLTLIALKAHICSTRNSSGSDISVVSDQIVSWLDWMFRRPDNQMVGRSDGQMIKWSDSQTVK